MAPDAFKEVAPGVLVHASARSVHYEHPTPDELDAAADEIDAIRMELSRLGRRLLWLSRPNDPSDYTSTVVGFRSTASESLERVDHALSPLIAYLSPHVQNLHHAAAAKREAWPQWVNDPEHHIVERGWPREDRPGTSRGCIVRVPARGQDLCGKQRPCPDHEDGDRAD